MSGSQDLLEMLERQAERLRYQIARQDAEHQPDYPQLAVSLQKVERDIEALRLLSE
ncbi:MULTISPECIES: hypothetical protein [unclassified Mesorhizobium]|uniref:hypothetical protein n=1 Tax=unclassified Mesorhizobium TaxID=325217 RepID=UPI00167C0794|nr:MULTISPECIES: hypothetical protein [unclassified Mesorhizobium]